MITAQDETYSLTNHNEVFFNTTLFFQVKNPYMPKRRERNIKNHLRERRELLIGKGALHPERAWYEQIFCEHTFISLSNATLIELGN